MTDERVVITGAPNTGKTTITAGPQFSGLPVRHTDDTIDLRWSAGSQRVSEWFNEPGPWVIEGVAAPRALRKWLRQNPTGKPCDRVLWLHRVFVQPNAGQRSLHLGMVKVWNEIELELKQRGVVVERISEPQPIRAQHKRGESHA